MSGRSKVSKFDKLWVVCIEEEARLATKRVAQLMRVRHLQLSLVHGKERRSLAGETSVEEIMVADQMVDQVLPEVMRGRTTRRFSAMDVERLVTLRVIVLILRENRELS